MRPSRQLAWYYGGVHGLALISLLSSPLPDWLIGALALVVSLHLNRVWSRHVRLTHPVSVRTLIWSAAGEVEVGLQSGAHLNAEPDWTLCLPSLIVLRLRTHSGRSLPCLISADALDAQTHRRLRVRLQNP